MSFEQLQFQKPEEILDKLHRETLPVASKLQRIAFPWHRLKHFFLWLTLAVIFLWFSLPFALWLLHGFVFDAYYILLLGGMILWVMLAALSLPLWIGLLLFNYPRGVRQNHVLQALSPIVGRCTLTEAVPMLLDFLTWLEPPAEPQRLRSLRAALVRLLPRVAENNLCFLLTPPRRRALRRVCESLDDTELTRVALLCLASVHDLPTVKIARHLKETFPPLKDAAEAFLDVVAPGYE
jgi:hypothetical protein